MATFIQVIELYVDAENDVEAVKKSVMNEKILNRLEGNYNAETVRFLEKKHYGFFNRELNLHQIKNLIKKTFQNAEHNHRK